jgi:hypothetical protein
VAIKLFEYYEPEIISCPVCGRALYRKTDSSTYESSEDKESCAHMCGHIEILDGFDLGNVPDTSINAEKAHYHIEMLFPKKEKRNLDSFSEFKKLMVERKPDYAIRVRFKYHSKFLYYFFKSSGFGYLVMRDSYL